MEVKELLPFVSRSPSYYVFAELLSVCFQAISRIPHNDWNQAASVGIWGDGIVGYLLSVCIKKEYPNLKVRVFGKHEEKLVLFSHADDVEIIGDDYSPSSDIDIAFEAVGGAKAGEAINQIIKTIKPCSSICLTGVSEYPVHIDTRKLLEKEIRL